MLEVCRLRALIYGCKGMQFRFWETCYNHVIRIPLFVIRRCTRLFRTRYLGCHFERMFIVRGNIRIEEIMKMLAFFKFYSNLKTRFSRNFVSFLRLAVLQGTIFSISNPFFPKAKSNVDGLKWSDFGVGWVGR